MLTIDDLGKRRPYTYKEIVEIDYPTSKCARSMALPFTSLIK